MRYLIFSLVLLLAFAQYSCKKDPMSDLNSGDWSNERSIENIKFQNQVGQPSIARLDASTGEVDVSINVDAVPDLSNIVVEELVLAYGATASVEEGDALNFENESNTATITVTSQTGKTRDYTVHASSFTEDLLGTYDISALSLFGGTGPSYGGAAVLDLTSKPWVWPETGGPAAELDNTITFELGGITEEGNTYGTITNSAGDDGMYADFVFMQDPQTDVNHFYRKIPEGEGEWLRNYNTGNITITFPDGSTTTATFKQSGTEDLGNGISKTIENLALEFQLNGTDDWDNIYSDYDKFVKRPRIYWIEINRQSSN